MEDGFKVFRGYGGYWFLFSCLELGVLRVISGIGRWVVEYWGFFGFILVVLCLRFRYWFLKKGDFFRKNE